MTYEQKLKQVGSSIEDQFINKSDTFAELFFYFYDKKLSGLIFKHLDNKTDFTANKYILSFLDDFKKVKVQIHKKYINDQSIDYNKFPVVEDKEEGLFLGYYIKGNKQIDKDIKKLILEELRRYYNIWLRLS